MRYKIKEIGDDGLDVEVPVKAAWLAAECPGLDAQPGPGGLMLSGRLERSGDDFFLRGKLEGALQTSCARCLEPAAVPLDGDVFVTFSDAEPGDEDEEPDDVMPLDGDVIDLGPVIHDEVILAMPVSPLCQPDCRGLCPVCGGNRNQVPCDCEERQRRAQGPMAALVKLKV